MNGILSMELSHRIWSAHREIAVATKLRDELAEALHKGDDTTPLDVFGRQTVLHHPRDGGDGRITRNGISRWDETRKDDPMTATLANEHRWNNDVPPVAASVEKTHGLSRVHAIDVPRRRVATRGERLHAWHVARPPVDLTGDGEARPG